MRLKKSDFHYELPAALIAQAPLPERSASRLLVVPPGADAFEDRHVRDLPRLLRAGDLLVFNDTRVIPARLFGQKQGSGGRVEILIERLLPGNEARAQIGASKSPKPAVAHRARRRRRGRSAGSRRRVLPPALPRRRRAGILVAACGPAAAAAVHPARAGSRRRRALPDRVRAPDRRRRRADRRPAFRRCAAGDIARARRAVRPRHPACRRRHLPAGARRRRARAPHAQRMAQRRRGTGRTGAAHARGRRSRDRGRHDRGARAGERAASMANCCRSPARHGSSSSPVTASARSMRC